MPITRQYIPLVAPAAQVAQAAGEGQLAREQAELGLRAEQLLTQTAVQQAQLADADANRQLQAELAVMQDDANRRDAAQRGYQFDQELGARQQAGAAQAQLQQYLAELNHEGYRQRNESQLAQEGLRQKAYLTRQQKEIAGRLERDKFNKRYLASMEAKERLQNSLPTMSQEQVEQASAQYNNEFGDINPWGEVDSMVPSVDLDRYKKRFSAIGGDFYQDGDEEMFLEIEGGDVNELLDLETQMKLYTPILNERRQMRQAELKAETEQAKLRATAQKQKDQNIVEWSNYHAQQKRDIFKAKVDFITKRAQARQKAIDDAAKQREKTGEKVTQVADPFVRAPFYREIDFKFVPPEQRPLLPDGTIYWARTQDGASVLVQKRGDQTIQLDPDAEINFDS